MNSTDLEEQIIEAIQRCCQNDEEKQKTLTYFANVTVNSMIEEALSDWK